MERTACVDIRALPLQLLLHRHPDWRDVPVVVVDKDKPQGIIQWANGPARASHILPGMRYATGLALASELHGAEVSPEEIAEAVDGITQRLWDFSPRIESHPDTAGVFWVDASGLGHIFPSLGIWADAMVDALREVGFEAVVAVGFSSFGSYAAARVTRENIVFRSPAHERAYLRDVPVEGMGLEPRLRDTLLRLGIDTMGRFIELPADGVRKRFGADAHRMHCLAHDAWNPIQASAIFEPAEETATLDWPEADTERLVAHIAHILPRVIARLGERNENLRIVRIAFTLEDGGSHTEEIGPATPTRDVQSILSLIRLRMERTKLSAGAEAITLSAEGTTLSEAQLDLFGETSRNMEEAQRAFAAIRADLGNDAVVRAEVREGHLPEACYRWVVMDGLAASAPQPVDLRPVVRRIYTPAQELPPTSRHAPDGWLVAGVQEGPVEEVIGPHIISGGWWRKEIMRTYHFARTRSGRWLWIYYDANRRRWFLQGEVQ